MLNTLFSRLDIFAKRLRNRIPEGLFDFASKRLLPYLSIIIVAAFTLIANFAKAAEQSYVYQPSDKVMDLSPADVAQVISVVGPNMPNIEADPVNVALAMGNSSYLDKPVISETKITEEPKAPEKRTKTVTYTVEGGDTLAKIAWKYSLKIATIKAANNLSSDIIRPGQHLQIPPQDLSPSQLANLQVKRVAGATVSRRPGSSNNGYPYGWCTYYVATRRYVPGGWGNARSWLSSAQRSGYATGSEPAAGAIVVLSESWMGHVAYVESVSGNSVTIAEMNYAGWGVVNRRVISAHGGKVMGYIY